MSGLADKADVGTYNPVHVQIIEQCIAAVDGKPNSVDTWTSFQLCWNDLKQALLDTDATAYNYLTK